jgi:hypothetical protein
VRSVTKLKLIDRVLWPRQARLARQCQSRSRFQNGQRSVKITITTMPRCFLKVILCVVALLGNGAVMACALCLDVGVVADVLSENASQACCGSVGPETAGATDNELAAHPSASLSTHADPAEDCDSCTDPRIGRDTRDASSTRLHESALNLELCPAILVVTSDPISGAGSATRPGTFLSILPVLAHAPVETVVLLC